MKEQGVPVRIVQHQDNMSTMQLARTGVRNSGKSRHMGVRINHVRDNILEHDIELVFTPTKEMIADILTKPLGGSIFRALRDALVATTH